MTKSFLTRCDRNEGGGGSRRDEEREKVKGKKDREVVKRNGRGGVRGKGRESVREREHGDKVRWKKSGGEERESKMKGRRNRRRRWTPERVSKTLMKRGINLINK